MINVSDNTKAAYLTNSTPKQLVIDVLNDWDVSETNFIEENGWYQEDVNINYRDWYHIKASQENGGHIMTGRICDDYYRYAKYLCFSFNAEFALNPGEAGNSQLLPQVWFSKEGIGLKQNSDLVVKSNNYTASDINCEYGKRFYVVYKLSESFYEKIDDVYYISLFNNSMNVLDNFIRVFNIQVELGNDLSLLPSAYSERPVDIPSSLREIGTTGLYAVQDIVNEDLSKESFSLTEALCSADNIKFGLCESSYVSFSVYNRTEDMKDREINVKQIVNDEDVPLGKFKISEVQKQVKGGLTQKNITAYDGLLKLEDNAADWYTKYMYCLDYDGSSLRYGARFARQIFSTYYDYAQAIGLEVMDDYTLSSVLRVTKAQIIAGGYDTSMKITNGTRTLRCCSFFVDITDTTKPYVFTKQNLDGRTDEEMMSEVITGWSDIFGRGAVDACVMYYEGTSYQDVQTKTTGTLVNYNDQFMLRSDTTMLYVMIPMSTNTSNMSSPICDWVEISSVNRNLSLTNAHVRLLYYNWSSKEVFPCESSITGRDVIRSLLEVCGCFYKLDREGKPQFKYCTKSSLYPSNELYPADDLYPRTGTDGGAIPTGLYYDFECEDYEVRDYGKIQIKKNSNSSDSKSIVEWQYIGNSSLSNAYIIEDNIFYCSSEMMYEYDSMEEVSEMLENMYNSISNMGFTPCEVKAVGMPYIECGDRITLLTANSGFETFIFARTLTGIQGLTDNFEAKGDEYNEEINDFGYKEWNGGT